VIAEEVKENVKFDPQPPQLKEPPPKEGPEEQLLKGPPPKEELEVQPKEGPDVPQHQPLKAPHKHHNAFN